MNGINIIERPLPDGPDFQIPNRIVVHAMAEYIDFRQAREPHIRERGLMFAPDYLELAGLSAHALIIPNGDIMRCRDDKQGAWHASGYNQDSLGVEFLVPGEHDYGSFVEAIKEDWLTEFQMSAGIYQLKEWISSYQIKNVDRHSDLSPERKVDPGAGFPWDELMGAIGYDKYVPK